MVLFDNIGDDEDSGNDRAIGDGDETIVKLDPCSLQQKVSQGLQSFDRDLHQEKTEKIRMFQWILRIAGISLVLLCILLLLVI